MKRFWVIPTVIFFLILVAYPFRWEEGPTQSKPNLKMVHVKDKWTGQAWIIYYGELDNELVSGLEKPVIDEKAVEAEKRKINQKKIMSLKDLDNKINVLAKELQTLEITHERFRNQMGRTQYSNWVNQGTTDKEKDERANTWKMYFGIISFDDFINGNRPLLPTSGELADYIVDITSPEVITDENVYIHKENQLSKLRKQHSNILKDIDNEVEAKLNKQIEHKRFLALSIWGSVLFIFGFTSVYLFNKTRKSRFHYPDRPNFI